MAEIRHGNKSSSAQEAQIINIMVALLETVNVTLYFMIKKTDYPG